MPSAAASRTNLDVLYSVMQSIEGKLGGGEGVEGIYGSITLAGMQRIYDCMRHSCGFDKSSTLVDVGAGLGRPLLHALVEPGARGAFGIELDEVKVTKAHAFLTQTAAELSRRGISPLPSSTPHMLCKSIEEVPSLIPATHAYSFWEGVPHSGKAAFGRLFAASKTLKAVAVVQRSMRGEDPAQLMQSLGFGPLLLISNFVVKMSGSGRNFQAYVFSKIKPESEAFIRRALPLSPTAPCTTAPLPVGSNTQAAATVATARVESATQEAADVTPSELVAAANVDASIAQPQAQPQVPHAVQVPLLQQWSGKGVVELLPPLQQPLQPPAAKEGAHMQSTTVAAAAAGDDSLQGFMCYQQQEGDGKSGLPLQSAAAAAVATGGDDSVQGFTHHQQHQDDGESGLPQYLLPGTPACGDPIRVHELVSGSRSHPRSASRGAQASPQAAFQQHLTTQQCTQQHATQQNSKQQQQQQQQQQQHRQHQGQLERPGQAKRSLQQQQQQDHGQLKRLRQPKHVQQQQHHHQQRQSQQQQPITAFARQRKGRGQGLLHAGKKPAEVSKEEGWERSPHVVGDGISCGKSTVQRESSSSAGAGGVRVQHGRKKSSSSTNAGTSGGTGKGGGRKGGWSSRGLAGGIAKRVKEDGVVMRGGNQRLCVEAAAVRVSARLASKRG